MEAIITFNHEADNFKNALLVNGIPLPEELEDSSANMARLIITVWQTDTNKKTLSDFIATAAEYVDPADDPLALTFAGWLFTELNKSAAANAKKMFMAAGVQIMMSEDLSGSFSASRVVEKIVQSHIDHNENVNAAVVALVLFGMMQNVIQELNKE